MPLRLTVLASGSAGNTSLLEADGFGVLLDVGLGPRQLASRLAAVGAAWSSIHAVLLTLTHGDHWNERTLRHLRKLRIPIYCHLHHHIGLHQGAGAFGAVGAPVVVRGYEVGEPLVLSPALP